MTFHRRPHQRRLLPLLLLLLPREPQQQPIGFYCFRIFVIDCALLRLVAPEMTSFDGCLSMTLFRLNPKLSPSDRFASSYMFIRSDRRVFACRHRLRYRVYRANCDKRKRHNSASRNGKSNLKTVSESCLKTIFCCLVQSL